MVLSYVNKPLVSVLTPSFNQMRFLPDCIQSVKLQTYDAVEHIIYDGGSSDGTVEYLANLKEGESFRWKSEADDGQAHALVKAFEASSGEIIGWLNSDDAYASPVILERVVGEFARRPATGVLFGHTLLVSASGEVRQIIKASEEQPRLLKLGSGIYQPSVFMRREVLTQFGFVNPTFQVAMDYELWVRLLRDGVRFEVIDEFCAIDRHHATRKVVLSKDRMRVETAMVHPRRNLRMEAQWRSVNARLRFEGAGLIGRLYETKLMPFLKLPSRPSLYLRQVAVPRML